MRKLWATVLEIAVAALSVILAIRWAWTQNGWFEPYTVICGCVFVCLEVYRRATAKAEAENPTGVGDTTSSLLAWLFANVPSKNLSETLPVALRLAQKLGDTDFERWVRFEFNGYNQRDMTEADSVPEYRNVPGRYVDQYKHMAPYYEDIPSLCVYRLPLGVRELEQHAASDKEISVHDPELIAMVRKQLGFNAERFVCYPAALLSVLDEIRSHLLGRLHRIQV
jgi:hypothetical protein